MPCGAVDWIVLSGAISLLFGCYGWCFLVGFVGCVWRFGLFGCIGAGLELFNSVDCYIFIIFCVVLW